MRIKVKLENSIKEVLGEAVTRTIKKVPVEVFVRKSIHMKNIYTINFDESKRSNDGNCTEC